MGTDQSTSWLVLSEDVRLASIITCRTFFAHPVLEKHGLQRVAAKAT
jgi:hypothetical protein